MQKAVASVGSPHLSEEAGDRRVQALNLNQECSKGEQEKGLLMLGV